MHVKIWGLEVVPVCGQHRNYQRELEINRICPPRPQAITHTSTYTCETNKGKMQTWTMQCINQQARQVKTIAIIWNVLRRKHVHLIHTVLVGFPEATIRCVLALHLCRSAEAALVQEGHGCICPHQDLFGCISGRHTSRCSHTFLIPKHAEDNIRM